MKRPEPPNGEKKGLNGVMKILREGPELQRQPKERVGGKTVNQGIAFGEQGADVTENGRKELSNEK